MTRCYDCQNYLNLTTKKTGGGVHFTREEFVAWKRGNVQNRRCAYCGIDSQRLYALRIVNVRTKRSDESIGVDRRDNELPYDLANLVSCCGPCNAIKGSILSDSEMRETGAVLTRLWQARLGVASS
jgi:5-methylcytosine-specific restriction endonuclease McrA